MLQPNRTLPIASANAAGRRLRGVAPPKKHSIFVNQKGFGGIGDMNMYNLTACRTAAILMTCITLALGMQAPASKPISKRGLIEALRLKGLTEQELIQHVEKRGVDFQLTAQDQTEIKEAGAGPQLIQAVRANYRVKSEAPPPPADTPKQPTPDPASHPPASEPSKPAPSTRPLSKAEILTLLETGVPSDRVEKLVRAAA